MRVYAHIVNGTKSTCTYNHQRERLQCMLFTANGDGIIKKRPYPLCRGGRGVAVDWVGLWL